MRAKLTLAIIGITGTAHAEQFLWAPLDTLTLNCDFCCYYGPSGTCHGAIDYRARQPQPVFAAASGTVERVVNSYADRPTKEWTYGNRVDIRHANGYLTRYAHLTRNSITVRVEDVVQAGQQIALSDNSGFSTGPHLHFEVRDPSGVRVNPYGDPPNYESGCGVNPLWATCPPMRFEPGLLDEDGDGYCSHDSICAPGLIPGDCMDSGETPEGVPASAVHPGAEEVCNYTDDDCDGETDEGFEGVLAPCDNGEPGECFREGVNVCTASQDAITCSAGAGIPTEELCDELDNDCDGEVDEDLCAPDAQCNPDTGTCRSIGTLYYASRSGSLYRVSASAGAWFGDSLFLNGDYMAEPACSPDGTKIAYTDRVVSRLRIFVVNSDGTDATGFTSTPADAREPAWSPDGTKIVFYADNNSGCPFSFRCPLYLLDVETGTVSEVTVVARPPLNPGFSFDGSQIIFGQEGQGMWIVNTDGSGLTEVPLPDLGQFLYQEWSPVDNRIFFYGSEGGDFYWFTVLPDGSNLINRGPAYMSASAWSPAASWVAVWGTPRSLRRYSTVTWADSGGWYPEVSPSSSLSWCP